MNNDRSIARYSIISVYSTSFHTPCCKSWISALLCFVRAANYLSRELKHSTFIRCNGKIEGWNKKQRLFKMHTSWFSFRLFNIFDHFFNINYHTFLTFRTPLKFQPENRKQTIEKNIIEAAKSLCITSEWYEFASCRTDSKLKLF